MRRTLSRLFVLVLVVATAGAGTSTAGPPDRGLDAALRAQARHTDRLLARHRVVGTAVSVTDAGKATLVVLTTEAGVRLRSSLGGVPVTVKVTGALRAAHHRPGHDGGPGAGGGGGDATLQPTDRFPRPVPIGISTGNAGECSAGTIGARVTRGGNVYALSNNHVYALENDAPIGSSVLQPGRYDTACSVSASNAIGTLDDFVSLEFDGSPNTVDAAIASTTTGDLRNETPADGYGTPSSTTANPVVGTAVLKYGRTTGLTDGTITAVNATVRVGYSSGTALFTGQVIVESRQGPVLKAGDSGSLVVTATGHRPVALLFAGNQSGKLGVANDIDDVLAAFGVSIG